ncbi:MAG: hypothetical protein ACRDYC_05645 [Acidimicrobiales bacterium]
MAFPPLSLTPPSLLPWQLSYNGLTVGAATPWAVTGIQGLDLATIRSADIGRPRDHGEFVGLDVFGGRDVTVNLWMVSDGVSLQDSQVALAAATLVGLTTEQPLWFQLPNLPLMAVMCRTRKRTMAFDINYGAAQVGVPALALHATDPRIYGPTEEVSVGLPVLSGQFVFMATPPFSFGGVVPIGSGVDNTGNFEGRPVLVITGPVTNPSISNASIVGNPTLTFSNPMASGFTVASGDQLVVDLDTHSVLYYVGGVASGSAPADRRFWLVMGSTWWNLPPGANNINFQSSDGGATGASCQIIFAPAYQL